MDRTARLYRIQNLLRSRKVVSVQQFLDELEISRSTFKRDLEHLCERMNAPIKFDKEFGGYRFIAQASEARHELPGVWFNAGEVHALLTMQQLLQELQPGLLTPHIEPLLKRLHKLLDSSEASHSEVQNRIRILRVNARSIQPKAFDPISTAVLSRRQLRIDYFHRARNIVETRTLCPQRLTYYRDNWYLYAWCHLRQAIRSFSLDAIETAMVLDAPAKNIPEHELDAYFNTSYGIFSGTDIEWAVLRFAPERARWVSREMWHPQQESTQEPSGHYTLRIPYSDDRELVMDILRHMPHVTVIQPTGLRERVKVLLEQGLKNLQGSDSGGVC